MTQNEVDIIKNSVLDSTEAYVEARLAVADFVKTQIGVVTSAYLNPTSKKWIHTVKCNATSGTTGIMYNNVLSVNNIHFKENSVVFMIVPNAQYSNQFILGKLDNVPYDIVGGSININDNFIVDSEGNVICENIDARAGKLGGFTLASGIIESLDHNVAFTRSHIGCGLAGNGIINIVGDNGLAYIQISNSGNYEECLSGIRIYSNGDVAGYREDGSEGWRNNLFDIPSA